MANPHGMPIWYELMSDEPARAEAFYAGVMGWRFEAAHGGAERGYRLFSVPGEEAVGGLMRRPDGAPDVPGWDVYFGVDDVDAAVEKAKGLGASVHMAPQDSPGVGRFAYLSDPLGAHFYLMRGFSAEDSHSFSPEATGHCSWNELVTSDQTAALAFYSALLGWTSSGAMPMGEAGDYTFIDHGGGMIGAVMDRTDPAAAPFWNFAFTVADIDAAKAAVEAGGGTVRHGPVELPDGMGWLIQASDPEGAPVMFTAASRG